jgi:hypothetical protein
MAMQSIYRIYTQEKNRQKILKLVSKQFESFTVQPILGYYKNEEEKSIVLEIVGARSHEIERLAETIRKMNGQKSVFTLRLRGDAKTIR